VTVRRADVEDGRYGREPLDKDLISGRFAAIGFRLRPEPWNRVEDTPGGPCPKLVFAPPAGERASNIHVLAAASEAVRGKLLFRDFLRAHDTARGAWGGFKQHLARSLAMSQRTIGKVCRITSGVIAIDTRLQRLAEHDRGRFQGLHAVLAVNVLVLLPWGSRLAGWLHVLPASLVVVSPGSFWLAVYYLVNAAWIVIFVTLALGHYRTARILAALAIVPGLVALLQAQLTGIMPAPFGPWPFWVLLDLAPVLAMTAFHREARPAARWPWLLALPAGYLLVYGPLLALQVTGNSAWLPDFSGRCCIMVSLACLAHAPRTWSRQAARTGPWSLTLALLVAIAGAYRIATLTGYLNDPHLINVSLAELLIMLAAVALIAPDAARAQTAPPAPPPCPGAVAA
jgi:GrpB protein